MQQITTPESVCNLRFLEGGKSDLLSGKKDGKNAIKYNKSNEIMIFIHEILQVK